jgi:hypothetical protein
LPRDCSGVVGTTTMEQRIVETAGEALHWLEQGTRHRRTGHAVFSITVQRTVTSVTTGGNQQQRERLHRSTFQFLELARSALIVDLI